MVEKMTPMRLPDELVAKTNDWAARMVAHYRSNGDPITAMPWTSDLMTLEEFKAWVASRDEAGRTIDIETCELGYWAAHDADPYGLHEALGEEFYPQIGTNRFVRGPHSRGWVWEG